MNVLFVCVQNAGRSQMAEALYAGNARSAGSKPATAVHPEVVEVMREVGVDVAGRTPARLTPGLAEAADVVVTMGCGDQCPSIPGTRYIDWDLPDPKGRPVEEVRAIRDDIDARVQDLLAELVPAGA